MTAAEASTDTRHALIQAAVDHIETVGFCAFSYRDLAERVGIRTPSIHYHFPTKGDLGVAVIRHAEAEALDRYRQVENEHSDVAARYRAKIGQAKEFALKDGRMCVFGSLLSDYASLPAPMQQELARIEAWVHATHTRWLDEGRRAGQLFFPGDPSAMGALILCTFQGVLMQHRARRDLDVGQVLDQILRLIGAA
jgi:TetR/AcrR family transcriptional repressor of nem operon